MEEDSGNRRVSKILRVFNADWVLQERDYFFVNNNSNYILQDHW